jgi:hypothetical protein
MHSDSNGLLSGLLARTYLPTVMTTFLVNISHIYFLERSKMKTHTHPGSLHRSPSLVAAPPKNYGFTKAHILGWRSIVLTCCLLFIANIVGLRGQTIGEYNFRQQSVIDSDSYSTSDYPPVLTMDCLAANGYGQFTLTSLPNPNGGGDFPVGWYLLANGLYKPSKLYSAGDLTDHPGCIPPGVVGDGLLSDLGYDESKPTEPKATANLDGWVSYVWPDPISRTSFDIVALGPSDFDLSLSGIPNPASSRQIAKPGSFTHTFSAITGTHTLFTTSYHDVSTESDFRDEFDVASDGAYLYIVWSSTVHPVHTGKKEIWVTVLDLGTSGTANSYFAPAMFIDDGERPTISCDSRANRGASPTPKFEVAYLTGHSSGSDNIKHAVWDGTSLTISTLSHSYIIPSSGTHSTNTYGYATHARVVVSSDRYGGSPTSTVYAIGSSALYYYKPPVATTNALYVDGPLTQWTYPLPVGYSGAQPSTAPSVLDNPIIAFEDPYEDQGSRFDPFHCLYQLDMTFPSGSIEKKPLIIVQGADNNTTNAPFTGETRLVLNQDASSKMLNDPLPNTHVAGTEGGWYVGAVNQMGIDVHWPAANAALNHRMHFYARDINRTFVGYIEENTLVTDICTVSDGWAHDATGATIVAGKQLTVWTDPNYGQDVYGAYNVDYGLYGPRDLTVHNPYVGTLQFSGDNVKLTVGGSVLPNPAWLAVMPFSYFDFLGSGQGVLVNGGSTFDYYGLNATHNNSAPYSIIDVATPFTNGSADGVGAGTIDLEGNEESGDISYPAVLNVHGGANFYLGPNGSLVSNYGAINIEYEPDVFPINIYGGGAANASDSGIITVVGKATISHSTITGHFPTWTDDAPPFLQNYIIRVAQSTISGHSSPSAQYTSDSNNYLNDPSTGASKVRIEGYYGSNTTSIFNADTLSEVVISGTNLYGNLTVENSMFANSIDPPIWLAMDLPYDPYGQILVSNNSFGKFNTLIDGAGAIELDDLYGEDNSNLIVENNSFITNDGQPDGTLTVAINLIESCADIVNNTITASKYAYGIEAFGNEITFSPNNSLICGNIVKNSGTQAVQTAHYNGYVKLNELASAEGVGYHHVGVYTSHLEFNNIHDNYGSGIEMSGPVDMSGIHHDSYYPEPSDVAGYNTVANNANDGSQQILVEDNGSADDAPLYLGQGSDMYGTTPSTWTVYGENNIMQGTGSGTVLIQGVVDISFGITGNCIPRDASNNYWGSGIDPNPYPTPSYCGDLLSSGSWPNFYYTLEPAGDFLSGYNFLQAQASYVDDGIVVDCGKPFTTNLDSTKTKKKGMKPQSSLDTTVDPRDSCSRAISAGVFWEGDMSHTEPAYDTMYWYLQHCYDRPDYDAAWAAFTSAAGPVTAHWPQDSLLQLRAWIMSERHLNPANGWYCDCIDALGGTYRDLRADLAILKFLIDNPRCAGNPNYGLDYSTLRRLQKGVWADTVQPNPNVAVFDSSLPSFHDIGLDSLLADAAAGVHYEALGPQIILDAHLTANPFPQQTSLSITTNREAYIHVEVFDLLGRQLSGVGYSGVFEPGTRDVPLNLSQAPSGSYYLRLSTANNETRTMKLSKE